MYEITKWFDLPPSRFSFDIKLTSLNQRILIVFFICASTYIMCVCVSLYLPHIAYRNTHSTSEDMFTEWGHFGWTV